MNSLRIEAYFFVILRGLKMRCFFFDHFCDGVIKGDRGARPPGEGNLPLSLSLPFPPQRLDDGMSIRIHVHVVRNIFIVPIPWFLPRLN